MGWQRFNLQLLAEIHRSSGAGSTARRGGRSRLPSVTKELFDNQGLEKMGGPTFGEHYVSLEFGSLMQRAGGIVKRRFRTSIVHDRSSPEQIRLLNGEFDPGSGRTLAACLTHASRTRTRVLALCSRVANG